MGGRGESRSSRPQDKGERGGRKKCFFPFGLKIRETPSLDPPLLSQFIAFPPSPFHISTDLLSLASACFLPLHMGAHDWVTRICQPWERSPSRSWLPIERRCVTPYYHGSKIFWITTIGSCRNNDGNSNKNGKKELGLY